MARQLLTDFLIAGRDLETHARGVMATLKNESKAFSLAAHAEAVNLARAVDARE